MPSVTTEVLRSAYERFYAGQADAHVELMASDIVAVDRSGALDAGTHRGLDEYLVWAQDFLALFSEIRLERAEIEQIRGDRVLALLHLQVVTHGAGIPVELTIGHVLHLREGRIVAMDAFIDEEQARAFALT